MKRVLFATLFAAPILAGEPPKPAAPVPYQVKRLSTVTLDREARAPFWPIGWEKPSAAVKVIAQPGQPKAKTAFQIQPQFFNVTSIVNGSPSLAMINGRSFAEGEVLPVTYGEQKLRVVLRAVRDGGVWLDYEGQKTFVELKRQEVGTQPKVDPLKAPKEFEIKIGPQ